MPEQHGGRVSMKKVLILMSDTGGGHRASAEALQAAFAERYGDQIQVNLVDIWLRHTPWPVNQIPKGYRFVVNDAPWLWRSIWEMSESPKAMKVIMDAAASWSKGSVSRVLDRYEPDLLIAVHPLVQGVTLWVMARTGRRVPLVTVVTDLVSVHPAWFHPQAILCYVPSEESYRLALQAGLPAERLRLYGLPIRPAFAKEPPPRAVLRQQLGMHPELPAALLVGGGEGMGRLGAIAHAVADRLAADARGTSCPAGQLVVICGRNRRLREELSAVSWPVPTIVNGFVQNMSDWMAACDLIVTKAGPGTIAEALIRGLPIVLSSFIAEQEEGNVPYVVRNGVGVYSEDPQQIATLVSNWFGPERAMLAEMSARAKEMGKPHATYQIVDDIAGLLGISAPGQSGAVATPPVAAMPAPVVPVAPPSPPPGVVRDYYDQHAAQEWLRLQRPYRRLEMESTLRLWDKYFPPAGHVCDIGCGPGRYAIELLQRGYRVTCVDLSSASLDLARENIAAAGLRAEQFICADARQLDALPDGAFDALLLMGPLYHVLEAEDRQTILRHAARLLKPGGVAILAYLNAWGVLRAGITEFPDSLADIGAVRALLQEFKQEGPPGAFTEAYFTTPPVALREVEPAGLEVVSYAGAEGFAAGLGEALDELAVSKPQVYATLVQAVAKTCELPQFRDATEHLQIVARKPQARLFREAPEGE